MATLAIPLAISALGGLAGLFGKKQQQDNSFDQNQTSSNTGSFSNYNMPVFSDYQQRMQRQLMDFWTNQMNQDADLSGYKNQQIASINNQSDMSQKALSNIMAARGLSFSPAATTPMIAGENARIGSIASFTAGLPLLQRQLRQQAAGGMQSFMQSMPVGSMGGGTSESTGTSHSWGKGAMTGTMGGGIGGGISDMASMLAYFAGQGMFGGNKTGGSKPMGYIPGAYPGEIPGRK